MIGKHISYIAWLAKLLLFIQLFGIDWAKLSEFNESRIWRNDFLDVFNGYWLRLGLRLSAELGYPVKARVMRERLERLLEREEHVVFVAETTEVAGWIHAADHELLEIGRHCEICGLVVGRGERGKGIAAV